MATKFEHHLPFQRSGRNVADNYMELHHWLQAQESAKHIELFSESHRLMAVDAQVLVLACRSMLFPTKTTTALCR